MIYFIKILRPLNLVIANICIILSAHFIYSNTLDSSSSYLLPNDFYNLLPLIIVVFMLGGFSNIINDVLDLKIDTYNNSSRPLPSKNITPIKAILFAALLFFISIYLLLFSNYFNVFSRQIICYIILPLMILYTPIFKKIPLLGNIIIGFILSMVFIITEVYLRNDIYYLIFPGVFAFIITVIREIIKDIVDIDGDRKYKIHTFPVVFGIQTSIYLVICFSVLLFIVSFIPYIMFPNNFIYIITLIILIHLPISVGIYYLLKNPNKEYCIFYSKLLKLITCFGIIVIYLINL